MEIEERTEGTAVVVSLNGRLDGMTAPDLEARVSAIVERGDVRLVLECSQMGYVSSAGLRVLLVSARKCQQGGREAGYGGPAARVSVGHGDERISGDHRVPRNE